VTGPGERDTAKERLLEQLMIAAREQDRELQAAQRPRRRRRRRALVAVVAVGLGAAAAAGAADLISTGEPVPDRTPPGPPSAPPADRGADLVAKAPDPDGQASWGVGVYTSATGRPCVMAGQVRGLSLGLMRDGRFHPYAKGTSGICLDSDRRAMVLDRLTIRGPQPRTVVFGLVRDRKGRVTATLGTRTTPVPLARGGAFLLVYSGNLPLSQPRIELEPPAGR
jgi:hypothetical protein